MKTHLCFHTQQEILMVAFFNSMDNHSATSNTERNKQDYFPTFKLEFLFHFNKPPSKYSCNITAFKYHKKNTCELVEFYCFPQVWKKHAWRRFSEETLFMLSQARP